MYIGFTADAATHLAELRRSVIIGSITQGVAVTQ